jgi:hypothetical protein
MLLLLVETRNAAALYPASAIHHPTPVMITLCITVCVFSAAEGAVNLRFSMNLTPSLPEIFALQGSTTFSWSVASLKRLA